MKKLLFLMLLFIQFGLIESNAQWAPNGINIYNTNSGNVGIGTNSPPTLLYVSKSTTEPTITIRNLGGFGGATYSMIDDASGANWKFKATLNGGFKIRDHANELDVIVIEPNSGANAIYIKTGGSLGIGTSSPHISALLDLTSNVKGFLPPRMSYTEIIAIPSPADGLLVYCMDCGENNSGALALYSNESWTTFFSNGCMKAPSVPLQEAHIPSENQIVWNWSEIEGALGYKWNTSEDYYSAVDLGSSNLMIESGLSCNTNYSRYVWAYNNCGHSNSLILTEWTLDCWACGNSIFINHALGNVAPVTKSTTYFTVTNIPGENSKCWITSNLGSDHQASSVDDISEASAGWYWQFNRKQGYKHDGTNLTPSWTINEISENSNWQISNDPCNIELGLGWRIPTPVEWTNIDGGGNWINWNGPWNSALKLHAAGDIYYSSGLLVNRGTFGGYWSDSQFNNEEGIRLIFNSSECNLGNYFKAQGRSVRCVK